MVEREYTNLHIYQYFSEFFASKETGSQIGMFMDRQTEYSVREWRLEYDFLLKGTDANREIFLWASAAKEDRVLLNQTTLDVITFYHKWGYKPVNIDGNPSDYIGEQLRFLSYLTSGIINILESQLDSAALLNARETFIQLFLLDTAKMVLEEFRTCTDFAGYISFMEVLTLFLASSEEQEIVLAPVYQAVLLFPDVIKNGLADVIENRPAETIYTAGINNCGGICVIKPEIQEGCMLNIQTDSNQSSPQIRACVRGRGYRKTFLNTGRLRYPMKRIGERGAGKFERISWEEAVDYVADRWKQITAAYGPGSRFLNLGTGINGVMRPGFLIKRLMALDGGFLDFYNNYSSACTMYTTPYVYGTQFSGSSSSDLLNTKLLILWGDNPAETLFGPLRNYHMAELKDKGVKIICIDPRQSQTAVAYADEWIPIKPTTDSALADAMAYVIWSEGLQDQTFMDTYCIGFDEAHIPEGVAGNESYHSYLFGEKDGIEKNAEWAEPITGVPAETIKRIAREYAKAKPACLMTGYGLQRHKNGEQAVRGTIMLTCLTGNVGISGGGAAGHGKIKEHDVPTIALLGEPSNPYPVSIPVFLWTKAIENGTEMTVEDDHIKGADHLDSNIKLIMNLASNTLINQHSNINNTIRVLKDDSKCELIVCSDIFMTPSAKYADIILPATSVFEGENMVAPWIGGNYILKNNQVIKPLFECRFEYEWMRELAAKIGLYEKFVDGKPEVSDWLREIYRELQKTELGLPDYDTFSAMGGYQFKDPVNFIAFKEQIEDPDHHPFPTPSGKIEIFSQRLYDMQQPDEIPAVPQYVPCAEGPQDPLKERYPLQLIGWHTRRRCHSIHDNNEWMDEIEKPGLWIHQEDAAMREIKQGDLVEVFNDRGKIRVPAVVTKRIMKGVVALSTGGWYTPDKDNVDHRGSINVLTSTSPTPLAKGNPQHTNLTEVRRVDN